MGNVTTSGVHEEGKGQRRAALKRRKYTMKKTGKENKAMQGRGTSNTPMAKGRASRTLGATVEEHGKGNVKAIYNLLLKGTFF